jgi:hypothetical protein
MTLACGPDNRLVHNNGGYTTTINDRGDVEWHPPPDLDTGQTRINTYHRPELLLRPPNDEDENPQPNEPKPPPIDATAQPTMVARDTEIISDPEPFTPRTPIDEGRPPPREPDRDATNTPQEFNTHRHTGNDQTGGGKGERGP